MKYSTILLLAFSLFLSVAIQAQNYSLVDADNPSEPFNGTYVKSATMVNGANKYTGPVNGTAPHTHKIIRITFTFNPALPPITGWYVKTINDSDVNAFSFVLSYSSSDPNAFLGVDPPSSDPANPAEGWFGPTGLAVGAVLPVEWAYFIAEEESENVALQWGTSAESNNKGFEVEYSRDARNWQTIDFVAGYGTSNEEQHYNYLHKASVGGMLYYRLKQMDYDGAYEYSEVRSVNRKATSEISIAPNPVAQHFTLQLPTIESGERVNVRLMQASGQQLWEQTLVVNSNAEILEWPTNVPAGSYFLLVDNGVEQWQHLIIKQ